MFSGLDCYGFSVDWVVSLGRKLWVHKEPGLYSMFRYEHVLMLTKGLRKCGHCISPTVSQHFVTPVTCRQHNALHCRSAICKPINALCYLVTNCVRGNVIQLLTSILVDMRIYLPDK